VFLSSRRHEEGTLKGISKNGINHLTIDDRDRSISEERNSRMKRTATIAAAALLAVGALSLSIAGEKTAAKPHDHEKPAMEAVINEKDIQTGNPTTAKGQPATESTENVPTPIPTENEPMADANKGEGVTADMAKKASEKATDAMKSTVSPGPDTPSDAVMPSSK
jgi:hypothetical protein